MTREEFWLQIYMASYNEFHDNWTAKRDADAAVAAYDKALKEYGEACKEAPVWPEGSLPWAMAQMKDGERYTERIYRKATGDFPNRLMPYDVTALDWVVRP